MIEALVYERLKTVAANVYPMIAPDNYATPAVVYSRLNTDPHRDMSDTCESGTLIFQIDVYDKSYLAAKQLADTIRAAMMPYRDDTVQSVAWIQSHDMVDQTTKVALYRVMQHFSIETNL